MNLTLQILLGITLLLAASQVQLMGLFRLNRVADTHLLNVRFITQVIAVLALIHLGQVLLWALALSAFAPELSVFHDAFYFALVTYTTVGYGDLTLGPGSRVFGAMASFAGILGFGMSTAFLVSLFTRARL